MAALASVFVEVLPKTDKFAPQLQTQLTKIDASQSAKKVGSKWGSAFASAAGAFAALGIVKFGKDSVSAFKEAEVAQTRLSDAFAKFPKLANVNIDTLRNLNTELSKKTKFDDDATASGQAVLAQFKLTGQQILQLTPLLQDYAAKTGKDLPTAATDLGKAMLGQGRALKSVGINFKDTGSAGGNFNEIVKGLRTQVGGFAEKEGKTGAGQAEILKNQFGELQEAVGSKLLPALTSLATSLLNVIGFVQRNSGVIGPLVATVGGLTAGIYALIVAQRISAFLTRQQTEQTILYTVASKVTAAATKVWTVVTYLLGAAMKFALGPVGLIITAAALLAAGIVYLATKTQFFQTIWRVAWGAIRAAFNATWNFIKTKWPLILAILTGPIGLAVLAIVRNWDKIKSTAAGLWNGLKAIWTDGVNGLKSKFLDLVGHIIDGAVRAFGWIPGLGGKLKNAQAEFRKFRDGVNAAMNGIKNKSFTVTASASVLMGQGLSRADAIATSLHRAAGGPIFGPGTSTSDSIPAMLSKGEHVLTAREVQGFGGHAAVQDLRKAAVARFAGGGPVDVNVIARTLGLDRFRSDIAAVNRFATDLVTGAAKRANATGGFSASLAGVVNFAKAMAGAPYTWAASGPKSRGFDCSGFVSNLVEVAKGLPLYRRLFATGSMGSYPWTNHFGGAFKVGWTTNAGGGIGHTGATVNGVNMESRGGDGVVVGSRSRGANYSYFNRHAFLARGGPVLPGDPPFDLLDPRGRHYRPGLLEALRSAKRFDSGGWLPPRSATVAVNGTDQWEPVGQPGLDYDRLAGALVRALDRSSLPSNIGREVHRNAAKGVRA